MKAAAFVASAYESTQSDHRIYYSIYKRIMTKLALKTYAVNSREHLSCVGKK